MPGGPSYADIEVTGGQFTHGYAGHDALWEILTWLRCPLVIYNIYGLPVWWGYVSEAAVMADGIEHRVSLDGMANRVEVAYSYVEPGAQQVGERRTTAWAGDAESVNVYGEKDLLVSIDGASDERAEAVRNEKLAQHRFPQVISTRADGGTRSGHLVARGWWSTLDWRFYDRAETDSLETTAQMAIMIAAADFAAPPAVNQSDILDTTAVSFSSYQDGERTRLDLMEEWLRTPTASGDWLTAWVTPERRVRIEAESRLQRWLLYPSGVFRRTVGERDLWPGEVPVGWTDLRGVVPTSANLSWLGAPSPFFVEEADYDESGRTIRWRPRGLPSPSDISRLAQG